MSGGRPAPSAVSGRGPGGLRRGRRRPRPAACAARRGGGLLDEHPRDEPADERPPARRARRRRRSGFPVATMISSIAGGYSAPSTRTSPVGDRRECDADDQRVPEVEARDGRKRVVERAEQVGAEVEPGRVRHRVGEAELGEARRRGGEEDVSDERERRRDHERRPDDREASGCLRWIHVSATAVPAKCSVM